MTPLSSETRRSGVKSGCPDQRDGPPSPNLGLAPSNSQAVGNSGVPARVPSPAFSGFQPSGVEPGCPDQRDSPSSPQTGFTPSNCPSRVAQTDSTSARASSSSSALLSGGFPKISSNFDQAAGNKTKSADQTKDSEAASQLGFTQPNSNKRSNDFQQNTDKTQAAQPSFADIAARKTAKPPDLFAHSLSAIIPVKDDDGVTVIMPQPLYDQRILLFQFALIGRIFLPPGSSPRSSEDYKAELSKNFQTTGDWNLLHLGKGFFSLQFRLQEDQLRAARRKSWRLSTGSIHLREWQPNFDPYKESSSTAQIWVRLFHLPTEYWHPEFLVGIFRSVGNVIKLDGNTAQGLVGHFARALVEIDLSKPFLESVRVGLQDNLFFVDFSYENIPLLCSFCHYIGHSVDNCRKAKAASEVESGNEEGDKKSAAPARKKQKWVEVEGEKQLPNRIVPVGIVVEKIRSEQDKLETSNTFAALQNLDSVDDTVPETQLSAGDQLDMATGSSDASQPTAQVGNTAPETQLAAGDIMDMVTGGSEASLQTSHISKEFTTKLLTTARECAMIRQLRSERDDTSAAAQKGTSAAGSADSDSGEKMDAQPSSTPNATAAPTVPPAAPNLDTSLDHNEAAGIAPSAQEAAALQPADLTIAAPPSDSLTGGEGNIATDQVNPSENNHATANKMVALQPAQARSITRRTKNKRKVKEVLPTRQGLRSSTKNKSISEITPEMIQAYAHNQCSVQVPADSLGKSKAIQVAPNSPHPKRAQLEDQLRTAAALGRHPTAYVLDTGQKGALKAMDLVANQQWDDIPHTEAYTDSDINSD